ncbi:hypothetical protein Y032_0013g2152 [Ancylostoma ceylanicum]|uniref:Uncharacterized protein n=1 Tax=Ancylostoma ceylanicum TaxID=53326 RepID=A0A016VCT8_9BILA|nr:hypothetical protein Y032_0013g2152 [Ancylostoma ceylanicum]
MPEGTNDFDSHPRKPQILIPGSINSLGFRDNAFITGAVVPMECGPLRRRSWRRLHWCLLIVGGASPNSLWRSIVAVASKVLDSTWDIAPT